MLDLRIEHLFEPEKHPKCLVFSGSKLLLEARGFSLRNHDTRRGLLGRVEYDIGIGLLQRRQFLIKRTKKQIKIQTHDKRKKLQTKPTHSTISHKPHKNTNQFYFPRTKQRRRKKPLLAAEEAVENETVYLGLLHCRLMHQKKKRILGVGVGVSVGSSSVETNDNKNN